MIDPGRPFSVPFAEVIARLEERIRSGVERPVTHSFTFQETVNSYELPVPPHAVTRVSGLAGNRFRLFEDGVHFRVSGSRLLWIHATDRPDNGKRVEVEFTVREQPPGLTDFNEGSVLGTLTRVVAREMAQMYAQMDEAYRRAFIDTAEGAALDNVVALLGVVRNPAQPAVGEVTFFRKAASPAPILVPAGTRVSDAAGRIFVTQLEGFIPAPAPVGEIATPSGGTVKTIRPVAEVKGVWLASANPDTTPPLPIRNTFGSDARTISFNPPPGVQPPSVAVRIRYIPRAATVPVQALEPGPDGNVNADTITIMPTPPRGVDGVTNEKPTAEGQVAEPDDRLRDRAKHALERAGNATVNAIKFAVLDVDGVEGCEVIDHIADDAVPLGEVRVRYSGGKIEDVRRAVEVTRAAGILARIEQIQTVLLNGTFFLLPGVPGPGAGTAGEFLAKAVQFLKAQSIGAALSVRRMNALAFETVGLAEVAEAQLSFRRPDNSTGAVTDPFLTANTEILRPDAASLRAVLLAGLHVSATQALAEPAKLRLSVQVRDSAAAAVTFRQFSLSVAVAVRAYSLTTPDAPPERIANLPKTLTFTNGNAAPLTITAAELAGFRPADHRTELEFVLSSPPYPGLPGETVKFTITS